MKTTIVTGRVRFSGEKFPYKTPQFSSYHEAHLALGEEKILEIINETLTFIARLNVIGEKCTFTNEAERVAFLAIERFLTDKRPFSKYYRYVNSLKKQDSLAGALEKEGGKKS